MRLTPLRWIGFILLASVCWAGTTAAAPSQAGGEVAEILERYAQPVRSGDKVVYRVPDESWGAMARELKTLAHRYPNDRELRDFVVRAITGQNAAPAEEMAQTRIADVQKRAGRVRQETAPLHDGLVASFPQADETAREAYAALK